MLSFTLWTYATSSSFSNCTERWAQQAKKAYSQRDETESGITADLGDLKKYGIGCLGESRKVYFNSVDRHKYLQHKIEAKDSIQLVFPALE